MNLQSIIGGPARAAIGGAGPVATQTSKLYADATTGAAAIAAPIAPAGSGGSAAVAAGVLAFAAVGVLVTMRVVFRGAVS